MLAFLVTSERQKLSNYVKTSDYVYVKDYTTNKLNPPSSLLINRIRMKYKIVQTNYLSFKESSLSRLCKIHGRSLHPQCTSSITQ